MTERSTEELMNDIEDVLVELEGEKFEIIDILEYEGKNYAALTKYIEDDGEEDEEGEFIILEVLDDPDEKLCTLRTVDDEELYTRIGDMFIEMFEEIFSEDENE